MCNAWNHPPGCNCGWGGSGTGGGSSGSWGRSLSSFSRSLSYGDPETRQICCWWCGTLVYYHTNGYGDSVLFDSLGYPWQVHECWQTHKNEVQQSQLLARINPFYSFVTSFVEAPSSRNSFKEQIQGYIVDNHIFYPNSETFTFLVDGCPAGYRWVYLDVRDGQGRAFRFLIPSIFANYYKNQSIIEIAGKWLNKGNKQILFATKISKISYPFGRTETREITKAFSKPRSKQKNVERNSRKSPETRKFPRKKATQNSQGKTSKKQSKLATSKKVLESRAPRPTPRRKLALLMYQQGDSLEAIAKSLDIQAEIHVLQMILKAAIQTVKDNKENPGEETIACMLSLSIKELRQKFGRLYKLESQGISLKDLGTS